VKCPQQIRQGLHFNCNQERNLLRLNPRLSEPQSE
jgi:hypothetical protein